MKYKVYIESVQKLIELNDVINTIVVENPKLYRSMYYNIENEFVFSENDNIIPLSKLVIVNNCLSLDINSKKNLSLLYKRLEKYTDQNDLDYLKNIESNIVSLIEKITLNLDVEIDYDDNLDFNKIFTLMKIRFAEVDSSNYIELIINYIKLLCELNKTSIIVFFGLSNNLTKEEFINLSNELKLLDIRIFDICNSKSLYCNNIFLIDEDYCII